jgi:hypothetical protein
MQKMGNSMIATKFQQFFRQGAIVWQKEVSPANTHGLAAEDTSGKGKPGGLLRKPEYFTG